MKNNLENAIKNSLQDYEVPYDPAAWESLSAKLDAQAGTVSGAQTGLSKWVLASVLVAAVAVGTFFLWPENKNEVVQTTPIEEEQSTSIETEVPSSENLTSEDQTETSVTEVNDPSPVSPINIGDNNTRSTNNNTNVAVNQGTPKNTSTNTGNTGNIQQNNNLKPVLVNNEVNYIGGVLSSDGICEGDNVVITNRGSKGDLVKFMFNEEWIVLEQGKTFIVNPKTSMTVTFVNEKGQEIENKQVKVYDLPSANFGFKANIFEKGLPVVTCQAYEEFVTYTWTFDNEEKQAESFVSHHFYEKGDYDITLKVVDVNGCENTTQKTVQILEKYNLMSPSGFKPNSSDSRNRTFMPYSLTVRDAKFHLSIVDPINNEVVFESNNAENGWDGISQKTGKMTPRGKVYIWKVQIFNPLPNERPIYTGTISHE